MGLPTTDGLARRDFLRRGTAGLLGALALAAEEAKDKEFRLATFSCDITPPIGHPLIAGWLPAVRKVDDPLRALGVVLLGIGRPVVLCALDWCGLGNEAFAAWQKALAESVETSPERVAIHCLHQHDAPLVDLEARRLLEAAKAPPMFDLTYFNRVVRQTAEAARTALAKSRPLTHYGVGQAKVERVAVNRRVRRPDGKVINRSKPSDPGGDDPEGVIDPWLKTLSFYNGEQPLAALHYYAVHPISYYGEGSVSSEFVGLARQKRQEDDPKVFQVYFTGAAGNLNASKYNDWKHDKRPLLRDRVYQAMKAAWQATRRHPLTGWEWRTEATRFPPRREKTFSVEASRKVLEDPQKRLPQRGHAALCLAWLKRIERPIALSCLDLGAALVVHLPGEPFVEYQLKAQELRKDAFVCLAGYGDYGPMYIPTDKAYQEGGYELTVAHEGPSEELLYRKLARLLQGTTREDTSSTKRPNDARGHGGVWVGR
ncbi:MAG TPA: hypothetical protein VH575_07440 [Gemmataceae bacterium]|jgi:hypothetical protein